MKDSRSASLVSGGWIASGSFFGSILSGILVGYFLDRWWGTRPWLLLVGFALGSYSGFMRLWNLSKEQDEPRVHPG
jgi:ATP synthase protein I